MQNSITITLTLTEEEVRIICSALIGEQIRCDEAIKTGAEYPDSEALTRHAEEAAVVRAKANALYHKVYDALDDAKYPMLRGEAKP